MLVRAWMCVMCAAPVQRHQFFCFLDVGAPATGSPDARSAKEKSDAVVPPLRLGVTYRPPPTPDPHTQSKIMSTPDEIRQMIAALQRQLSVAEPPKRPIRSLEDLAEALADGCDAVVDLQKCVLRTREKTDEMTLLTAIGRPVTIKNGTIAGPIAVEGGEKVVFQGVRASAYVWVRHGAEASFVDCTLGGDVTLGVGDVRDGAEASFVDCTLKRVYVQEGGKASLTRCTLGHVGAYSASVQLSVCTVQDDNMGGICVYDASDAVMTDCIVRNSPTGTGIRSYGKLRMRGRNIVEGNGLGLTVRRGVEVVIEHGATLDIKNRNDIDVDGEDYITCYGRIV